MSAYNEFQGALDRAKTDQSISDADHAIISNGTRAAFDAEPDVKERDKLRVKWLKLVTDGRWAELRAVFAHKATKAEVGADVNYFPAGGQPVLATITKVHSKVLVDIETEDGDVVTGVQWSPRDAQDCWSFA